MSLSPRVLQQYHVFLASPGDVNDERQHVRRFFDDFNRSTARLWNAHFQVVDWKNHSMIGVGPSKCWLRSGQMRPPTD